MASAANAAAATTLAVNGGAAKSIYKPGGTDAPNIIAGKAYTVWYDAADNFFVKASAYGDVIAANVLADKIFSSDEDTGLTGTMPNNAADVAAVSYHASGTSLHIVPATGYTDGVDDAVVVTDAEFIAENILSGVNIFGVAGTLIDSTGMKRFASGSIVILGASGGPVAVTGLTFRPSTIVVRANGGDYTQRLYVGAAMGSIHDALHNTYLATYYNSVWGYKLARDSFIISDTGFSCKMADIYSLDGITAYWIAYE